MQTHPLPPPDSDCVMQDVQPAVVSSFGCFIFKFWVLRFRDFGVFVFDLGCFVFEIWVLRFRSWVLRFRVLGASFSRFGCFVFEIWVLRASVFVFECFVFETTKLDRINFIYCDHDDDPDVDVDQQTTPNHLCSHATYCSERIYSENRRQ